jgi:menaquinol-cytochrome c reductase iron-sulfur subunit
VTGRPITRRNFIVWYLAGLLTATAVAVLAPILVYIWPPQGAAKPTDLKVNLPAPLDQIADGDGVKIEAPKAAAFTMVDGGGDNAPGDYAFGGFVVKAAGKVNVFAVNCSHLGCSIALNAGAKRFECPCHGSMFALNGNVIHGPAVAPLSHLDWKPGDTPDTIVVKGVSLPGYG